MISMKEDKMDSIIYFLSNSNTYKIVNYRKRNFLKFPLVYDGIALSIGVAQLPVLAGRYWLN